MRLRFALFAIALLLGRRALALPPLEYQLTVPASPLQAYNALTVDWQLRLWMSASGAISESRAGGLWRVTFAPQRIAEGLYAETERAERLVYSQFLDDTETTVTVRFIPDGEYTRVEIQHAIVGDGRAARRLGDLAAQWWTARLPELERYLTDCPGAYFAAPPTYPSPLGVLVLHDRFGLNRTARALCDSLAAAGFFALAPDMFRGDVTGDLAQAARFLDLVNADDALAEARRGLLAVRERSAELQTATLDGGRAAKPRLAVLGTGFGGTQAILLAAADPKLKACVVWQGAELPETDLLRRIACPVLGVFGDFNPAAPRAAVAAFDQALVRAAIRVETVVFLGPPQFADPAYGESYNATTLRDAWLRTLRFLDKQLRY